MSGDELGGADGTSETAGAGGIERPALLPDVPVSVAKLVRRVLCDNPGPMTGPGTNTYLVGIDEVAVIDPGPDLPAGGKIVGLEGYGLRVVERVPIEIAPGPENLEYLQVKRDKMGHMLHHQELRLRPDGEESD